jgi:hypothetical protein
MSVKSFIMKIKNKTTKKEHKQMVEKIKKEHSNSIVTDIEKFLTEKNIDPEFLAWNKTEGSRYKIKKLLTEFATRNIHAVLILIIFVSIGCSAQQDTSREYRIGYAILHAKPDASKLLFDSAYESQSELILSAIKDSKVDWFWDLFPAGESRGEQEFYTLETGNRIYKFAILFYYDRKTKKYVFPPHEPDLWRNQK